MAKKSLAVLEGMKDVVESVQAYMTALEPKEIEGVLLVGARIIRDKAKKLVRVKTKRLRKAIRAKVGRRRGKTHATAFAAVDRKKAPHAHLIEFGHALVKDGKTIGTVPAYPFLGPAVEQTHKQVAATVRKGLAKGLDAVRKKRKARRTIKK